MKISTNLAGICNSIAEDACFSAYEYGALMENLNGSPWNSPASLSSSFRKDKPLTSRVRLIAAPRLHSPLPCVKHGIPLESRAACSHGRPHNFRKIVVPFERRHLFAFMRNGVPRDLDCRILSTRIQAFAF